MSDYLWDKTGEADPEVERLEELLGELRYRPREFKLPPEIEARTAALRVRNFNPRRASAIAAALLLALFAGLWFVTQHHAGEANEARLAQQPPAAPSKEPRPDNNGQANTSAPLNGDDARPPQLAREAETPRQTIQAPPAQRQQRLAKRERRGSLKTQGELATNTTNKAGNAQIIPAGFSADEQQQAKAQLMYALRLTSAKLGEVQPKARQSNNEPNIPRERNLMR